MTYYRRTHGNVIVYGWKNRDGTWFLGPFCKPNQEQVK